MEKNNDNNDYNIIKNENKDKNNDNNEINKNLNI